MTSQESREKQLNLWRERRRLFKIKCLAYLGGVCIDCGASDNLEFSHNNPTGKEFNIPEKCGLDWDTVIRPELDKCSLRCHRCHNVYDGKQAEVQHGTLTMYSWYKCRCPSCIEANTKEVSERRDKNRKQYNAYMRDYRARKKATA